MQILFFSVPIGSVSVRFTRFAKPTQTGPKSNRNKQKSEVLKDYVNKSWFGFKPARFWSVFQNRNPTENSVQLNRLDHYSFLNQIP